MFSNHSLLLYELKSLTDSSLPLYSWHYLGYTHKKKNNPRVPDAVKLHGETHLDLTALTAEGEEKGKYDTARREGIICME